MKGTLNTTIAGPAGVFRAGRPVDLPADLGKALAAAGVFVPASSPAPPKKDGRS